MKRKPYKMPQRTVEELKSSLNCSIPEARRLTGYSRAQVDEKISLGQWRWFWEGKRKRIITSSITEYQDLMALSHRQEAGPL